MHQLEYSIYTTKLSNFELATENNEALVLHTSGTTSRPKVVPLTNKNIFSSAINISNSLRLSSQDHCYNIMPLFHIHGLIAVLSSSITCWGVYLCEQWF